VRLILASGSARRPELLAGLGLPFEVVPTGVDETSDERDPVALARLLALRKARAGAAAAPEAAVIAADTLVTLDGRFFGKPADAAEARATLQTLRGRTHQVVSGVAVVAPTGEAVEAVTTHVTMRAYTDAEIDAYIATGDPLDKSGAYAIQHPTFAPAAAIDGCLCSVIGLPLWTTRALLASAAHFEASPPAFDRCASCPLRA
jgi:septum formation protein